MALLIAGLTIFFCTHLTPGLLGQRQNLVDRFGERLFTGLYIAFSVTGMLCIVAGKSIAPFTSIYYPPIWARPVVAILVAIACVFLAIFFVPSNFRRVTRHPMLWAITFWSAGHLIANGDLASILMFGGFGLYSLISMWSLNARGAEKSTISYSIVRDIGTVALGLGLFTVIVWAHPFLFGVPALP